MYGQASRAMGFIPGLLIPSTPQVIYTPTGYGLFIVSWVVIRIVWVNRPENWKSGKNSPFLLGRIVLIAALPTRYYLCTAHLTT